MDSKTIRYKNSRHLIDRLGGVSAFAEKLGKQQSQVSAFAGSNPTKGIGNTIARQIEDKLKLPPGWMDLPHTDLWGEEENQETGFQEGAIYDLKNNIQGVPVVGKAELGPDGFWEEQQYPVGHGDGFINWPTTDPNAYAVEAHGDSMAPRIKHREFIIVEPNTEVMPGDEVLIKTNEHPPRCLVKVYQYTRDGRIHLGNINQEFEDFRLDEDMVVKMHFVAGYAKRRMHRHE